MRTLAVASGLLLMALVGCFGSGSRQETRYAPNGGGSIPADNGPVPKAGVAKIPGQQVQPPPTPSPPPRPVAETPPPPLKPAPPAGPEDEDLPEGRLTEKRAPKPKPEKEPPLVSSARFAGPLAVKSWVRTRIYGDYNPLGSVFRGKRHNRYGNLYYHQGVDVLAPRGTPIIAPEDGAVVEARNWDPGGYGRAVMVRVRTRSGDLYILYAHLDQVLVAEGQLVRRGERTGTVGRSGNAARLPQSEEHVHVEVRTKEEVGRGLDGRLDPLRYFPNVMPPKELTK